MIVAALAGVALLSGYVRVLDGAVRSGELRRVATADNARSVSSCNTLPLKAARTNCLLQLSATLREAP
jgi:hypothetical protein